MRNTAEPIVGPFPSDFVFGTATAAYQIEGAVAEDGRTPSIWDEFCDRPGAIADGSSGAVACDHYHRLDEDLELISDLGAQAYRFSIAWPRVQPGGSGPLNPVGLGFYDRLIDGLLAAGIQPWATLYHWDLPLELQTGGGWAARETADRFAEYAAAMAARFGDRVAGWMPINEPNVHTLLGHGIGVNAPGSTELFGALPVAHHLLLAHGRAVQALRAVGAARVGCVNNHAPIWPASEAEADVAAAGLFDLLWNGTYRDAILTGAYPPDLAPLFEPVVAESDMAVISQPLDFYGVNYYNPMAVAAPAQGSDVPFDLVDITGHPVTDFGWPVVPEALTALLVEMSERFDDLPPVVITECGASYAVGPDANGVVDDRERIEFHRSHLAAATEAIAAGVEVQGYFAWSLMDNFEWDSGYQERFGLVHIDYETLVRTPKASYRWYRDLIAAQR